MVFLLKKLLLSSLLILFISTNSFSAPSVSGVGSLSHGSQVVISGNDFGTKSTAAPIRWDNFEDNTTGQSIGTATSWWVDVEHTNKVTVSTLNQRTGSAKNVRAYGDYTDGMAIAYKNSVGFSATGKILVCLWIRFDWGTAYPNVDGGHQVKTWRVANSIAANGGATYPDFANFTHKYASPSEQSYFQNHRGTDSNTQYWTHNYISDDTWFYMMLIADYGTAGESDGSWRGYLGKSGSAINSTPVQTNVEVINSGYGNIDSIKLDNYIGNCDDAEGMVECTDPTEVELYYDDIYIDNSWARVEIGDQDTYANCTHREIQIPAAWSATEITVTANTGSFGAGDSVYVFVVDEDGVASAGYGPVTIGSTAPRFSGVTFRGMMQGGD